MKVLKFGGTSIGNPERIKNVARLVSDKTTKIIVLSAMSGTTNDLVKISNNLYNKNTSAAEELITSLENKYLDLIPELFSKEAYVKKTQELVYYHIKYIFSFTLIPFSSIEEKALIAQGELLSTALFHYYLGDQNISSTLIPALSFMRIDMDGEPDKKYIREKINREVNAYSGIQLFITQGFIARNAKGEIDNLKRGGSDYSASLIGEAIGAEEIQIWTDIDGMHNNDPRIVKNTRPLAQLSFDEAAELAYFGAKILHPASIQPAKRANIPVRLKNSMFPFSKGTLITSAKSGSGIKAIAAKDGITAVKIKSGRMLLAYGFLRKVFEIFEAHKTSIDMITTSEVAVSVTIDENHALESIEKDLKKYGTVQIDQGLTIICIVGDFISENKGLALIVFRALKDIPVRMISYGGSKHNVSILIKSEHKVAALTALNSILAIEVDKY